MSMTNVGHVDVVGLQGADWEICVAIIVLLLVSLLYIFVVGNATALLLKKHQQVDSYRTKLADVDGYLRKRRVRSALSRLVRQHVKDSWTSKDKIDDSFLDELPRALRNEVLRDINMKVLRRAPIFFSCDKAMLGVLCGVLRRCVFLKGDVLSQQGGVANE
eukprot:7381524-Prymnesium_polylepis.1